jgi:hypothetical protein
MGQLSAEAAEKERLRREKELAEALAAQNATFDLAQSGVNALLQLNEAFTGETEAQQKKAFERRKKLEIAGALISSAQGVVNILSNKSAVPSPFDIPFKAAQIGVLLATTNNFRVVVRYRLQTLEVGEYRPSHPLQIQVH